VLASPVRGASRQELGVLIVVGGPQYRVGSHRQFALTARTLAAAGWPVLRFDRRGMGDSDGTARPFDNIDDDIAAAVRALRVEAGVSRVVLWGLCDGASAGLMYVGKDPDVAGIVALNPWARAPATEASTRLRHYYLDRLRSRAFWTKLFRGGVAVGTAVGELARSARTAVDPSAERPHYLRRMEAQWTATAVPVVFILSGRDYTAREFEAWVAADAARQALLDRRATTVVRVGEADHTFSSHTMRNHVADETIRWIKYIAANL
jgi:exosortase A-associated hydrolase 1